MTNVRSIYIVETAKIVRAELKAAFPGIKFSVRSEQYSMGCHLYVSWTDGPAVRAVEAITDQFYGTGFDGMTDSTTYHDSIYKGEAVHFSGSRPHCSRRISEGFEAKCGQAWEALSEIERDRLEHQDHFPQWQGATPAHRLATFLSA